MHYYSLLRMFQQYTYKERGPNNCKNMLINKNIIFYAGDAHIRFFKGFINEYYNIKPNISIQNETNLDDIISIQNKTNLDDVKSIQQCIKFDKPFNYFETIPISNKN